MTKDELCAILEQYTVCVIRDIMRDVPVEEQYQNIANAIEKIADCVMITTKKCVAPSLN